MRKLGLLLSVALCVGFAVQAQTRCRNNTAWCIGSKDTDVVIGGNLYSSSPDGGVSLSTSGVTGANGTSKVAVLDAGVALINGQLQVLGPSVLQGVTATTANATTSANTPFATAAAVDAGSVRIANTYAPIAASQDGGTNAMTRIQFGMCVLSANSCAVTFNTAFSTIPQCLCTSVNATAAACGVSATPSTSAVTFKGANASDQIQWVCFGDK
jgi:hypothetical protein